MQTQAKSPPKPVQQKQSKTSCAKIFAAMLFFFSYVRRPDESQILNRPRHPNTSPHSILNAFNYQQTRLIHLLEKKKNRFFPCNTIFFFQLISNTSNSREEQQ
jgi:hypothetical protein